MASPGRKKNWRVTYRNLPALLKCRRRLLVLILFGFGAWHLLQQEAAAINMEIFGERYTGYSDSQVSDNTLLDDSGDSTTSDSLKNSCGDESELCVHRPEQGRCFLQHCRPECRKNQGQNLYFKPGKKIIRDQWARSGTMPLVMGSTRSHSGCIVSRKYRFIFVHVLKSGGITMKTFLPLALCGPTKSCQDKDVMMHMDCRAAFQAHSDFFTFSFIRNPYARYYSAFAMADAPQFRQDPNQPLDIEAFANTTRSQRSKMTKLSLSHFTPQWKFLFNWKGCPAFDFVGRLESIDEDIQTIMTLIDSPELWAKYRADGIAKSEGTNFGSRAKGANFSLATFLGSPIVQEEIQTIFREDFSYFGFNTSTIP